MYHFFSSANMCIHESCVRNVDRHLLFFLDISSNKQHCRPCLPNGRTKPRNLFNLHSWRPNEYGNSTALVQPTNKPTNFIQPPKKYQGQLQQKVYSDPPRPRRDPPRPKTASLWCRSSSLSGKNIRLSLVLGISGQCTCIQSNIPIRIRKLFLIYFLGLQVFIKALRQLLGPYSEKTVVI